jgi:hypothetical protein
MSHTLRLCTVCSVGSCWTIKTEKCFRCAVVWYLLPKTNKRAQMSRNRCSFGGELIDWFVIVFGALWPPVHLEFNRRGLCTTFRFMGDLLPYQSSRWPSEFYSLYHLAPRKKQPNAQVLVKPGFYTHKNMGRCFVLFSAPPKQWTVWQPH